MVKNWKDSDDSLIENLKICENRLFYLNNESILKSYSLINYSFLGEILLNYNGTA